MSADHDYNQKLLKWRYETLKRQGQTYRALSEDSGVPQATLCDVINGKVRPFPNTIKKTFLAVGLDPQYAFSDLKRSQYHLAVL